REHDRSKRAKFQKSSANVPGVPGRISWSNWDRLSRQTNLQHQKRIVCSWSRSFSVCWKRLIARLTSGMKSVISFLAMTRQKSLTKKRMMNAGTVPFCSSQNIGEFQAMMLDVMDNLPRCRFSSAQMSLIIHFAKQLGAPDVPSLKGFRKMQQMLQSTCG
ncbi:hypothetical protein B0H19DRAFT_1186794, partial [Mycena capillaripes]